MASDHIRASDADRDAVVGALTDAYTAGRLTLEEFDERSTAAYTGKTWGELRELTRDLPETAQLGADLPKPPLPPAPRLDTDRVLPAQPHRASRGTRIAPILAIWIIAGLASKSLEVGGALILVVIVALLASSFRAGWRDDDGKDRNSRR
jgi:hypothetical protein